MSKIVEIPVRVLDAQEFKDFLQRVEAERDLMARQYAKVCQHRGKLVAELEQVLDALRGIAKLCQAADDSHEDFVAVVEIDSILGTTYGR